MHGSGLVLPMSRRLSSPRHNHAFENGRADQQRTMVLTSVVARRSTRTLGVGWNRSMSGTSAERTDVRQYVEAGKLALYANDQWHVVLKAGPESSVQLFLLGIPID